MKSRLFSCGVFLFALVPYCLLVGCTDSGGLDAKLLAEKQKAFLLTDEPDGELHQVVGLREALLGTQSVDEHGEEDHEHDEADHDHEHEDLPDDEDPADLDLEHARDEEQLTDGHEEEDHGHEHEHSDEKHSHELAEKIVTEVSLPSDSMEVVVMGQIGGLTNPWAETQPDYPFAKKEAKFFLADAGEVVEAQESGHVHAPGEECPFCAAHAKDNVELIAVVQFVDEKGKILPMDVRELFDLKEKDTVVVRGKAQVIPGGLLVVEASGIYVRR